MSLPRVNSIVKHSSRDREQGVPLSTIRPSPRSLTSNSFSRVWFERYTGAVVVVVVVVVIELYAGRLDDITIHRR